MSDGSALTESATIQSICQGQRRTQTYTDSKGNFSFEFGSRIPGANGAGVADASNSSVSSSVNVRDLQSCELQAALPGFASDVIELSTHLSDFQTADVGRIVLHRMGNVEGLTISVTSAAAPDSARKALEKGRDQAKKQKWDEALKSFQKAVEIYPKYAVAWFEIGRIQLQNNEADAARNSFNQALAADAKYANPYRGLAQLALKERKWQELIDVTEKLLALNPLNFPDAWFFNSIGNVQLQKLDAAERSARQALKLDEDHHIPKIDYVLALVLAQKHEYQDAAAHMRQFLQLATVPADIEEAQKQLASIEKLAAATGTPALNQAK